MSKLSSLSDKEIHEAIAAMQNGIAIKPGGEEAKALQVSIDRALEELQRRANQKKSEAQSQPEQEEKPNFFQKQAQEYREKGREDLAVKVENEFEEFKSEMSKAVSVSKTEQPIRTVKAPDFVTPDELINVVLEDQKGNEYTRTYTKAQVRALARKYFSNVHESWQGKDRKMGVGFKNLLAYVVAWREFDGALPTLRDVLLDYDRYNKGGEDKEPSDAFKVAQELYEKIVSLIKQN